MRNASNCTWWMGQITHTTSKIAHKLIIYIILVVLVLCMPTDQTQQNQCNDSTKRYKPKSKQTVVERLIEWMTNWIKSMYDQTIHQLDRWSINNPTTRMEKRISILRHCTTNRNHDIARTRRRKISLLTLSALAMQSYGAKGTYSARTIECDTDSDMIGIDNRCSACISHKIEDFVDTPVRVNRPIKGFGGTKISNVMSGTIQWTWLDDLGQRHKFRIPRSYYVPDGNVRLLSPQHWAKTQVGNNRNRFMGTGSETTCDKVTLFWNQRSNMLTVPISKRNNVATFPTAPGFDKFSAFCQTAEIDYAEEQRSPELSPSGQNATTDDEESVTNIEDTRTGHGNTHQANPSWTGRIHAPAPLLP